MFKKVEAGERAFDAILKQIIANIEAGDLKAGAALPAERAMAEAMGVSRPAVSMTVHRITISTGEDTEFMLMSPLAEWKKILCTLIYRHITSISISMTVLLYKK